MERPAGMAAYRAWRLFGRQLMNKAAIEQLMRWCRDWIDANKPKPRPELIMPTVRAILRGPRPVYVRQVMSVSRPSLSDVLPGPLPPPSAITNTFPSPLHAPSVAADGFKAPSLGPVLPCPSALVPPVVPPAVVKYASLKRWGAAGCALVAGALLYIGYVRLRRPTPNARRDDIAPEPATPDARRDDIAPEPATPDATASDATDPDAIDEKARARARFIMFVLCFATLCFPAGAAGTTE